MISSSTKGDDFLAFGQSTFSKTSKTTLLGNWSKVRPCCKDQEPKQQRIGTMEKQNKEEEKDDMKGGTFDFSVSGCLYSRTGAA